MDGAYSSRRRFIRTLGTGLVAGCFISPADGQEQAKQQEETSPNEDLMREHGILKRVLLVYQEVLRRIGSNQEVPPQAVAQAAGIIRNFIEDYHEKLEENHLFPRFEKANQLVTLVKTLRTQHDAGRKVTDVTLKLATPAALKNLDERRQLAHSLHQFIRMYSPHEAREDTVLFPAFKKLVTLNEYDALGEQFENEEHKRFGQDGFETMVNKVADIEKTLGIYDLAQFTPKV